MKSKRLREQGFSNIHRKLIFRLLAIALAALGSLPLGAVEYYAYRATVSLPMLNGEFVSGEDRIITTLLTTSRLVNIARGALVDLGRVQPLQRLHAGEQPRLEVLHALRVVEPARQLHERALDHARPHAQITLFERGIFRPAPFSEEALAAFHPQVAGVVLREQDARPAQPRLVR